MASHRIPALHKDRRGVVMVEFALWSSLILAVLLVSADFGIYTFYKARLARAVSAASLAAFNTRDNIDTASVAKYVTATANIPGITPAVTVTCNGNISCDTGAHQCGCISLTDGSFSVASACGIACPSGSVSGSFITISAKATYHHVVLPNPWLEGQVMTATTTVRL